jgi:ferrous iron transport protein B
VTASPELSSRSTPARAETVGSVPTVVIVGNPNVGKTTVFNRLTGHNARVGKYPGITVERRVGRVALDGGGERALIDLVDVPGT